MNNAQALAECIKKDTRTVFGYSGGMILPLMDALHSVDVNIIINSNEQCAAFAAAGISRSTSFSQTGICVVTSGPSVTNTLTAVHDAYCDQIPLIVISGQVTRDKLRTDAFQYTDVQQIFSACTKKVYQPRTGENVQEIYENAKIIANTYPKGPVIIDLPLCYQREPHTTVKIPLTRKYKTSSPLARTESIMQNLLTAQNILLSAKKPLALIGGGCVESREKVKHFIEKNTLPFVYTLMGKNCIDDTSPHNLGMIGMFGEKFANMATEDADVVLVLGARLDERAATKIEQFAQRAKIIFVNTDTLKIKELSTKLTNIVFLHGTVQDILPKLSVQSTAQIQKCPQRVPEQLTQNYAIARIAQSVPQNAIVFTGVGNHQMIACKHITCESFITSGAFGTMGFALPTAIGSSFDSDRPHYVIDGDGCAKMNMGEFLKLVEYKRNIKLIILNNDAEGMVQSLQQTSYTYSDTSKRLHPTNFKDIAQSCGISSVRVEAMDELEDSIEKMNAHTGPFVLEICTPTIEHIFPKVPAGKPLTQMIYE